METKTKVGLCFMCATVVGLKRDEDIIYETEQILVVKDKNPIGSIHQLIYPKIHIEHMRDIINNHSLILEILNYVSRFILNDMESESQICLHIANCPRHQHLHLQLICGISTSIVADENGTPNPSPGT